MPCIVAKPCVTGGHSIMLKWPPNSALCLVISTALVKDYHNGSEGFMCVIIEEDNEILTC